MSVVDEVLAERERQERKCEDKRAEGLVWLTCASPAMPHEEKLAVLVEEVGEVARELCDARAEKRPPAPNLRVELIQVAAIAIAWVEALDPAIVRGERDEEREPTQGFRHYMS